MIDLCLPGPLTVDPRGETADERPLIPSSESLAKCIADVSGFTLVELVITLLILGIVSAYVVPKFFNFDDYRLRSTYDEVAGAVRYAQKLAVGSGCEVQVHIAVNSYALQQHAKLPADTVCGTGGFVDISDHPVTKNSFADVSLFSTAGDFIFDAWGRSSVATTVQLNSGSMSFSVIAETGYVDAP